MLSIHLLNKKIFAEDNERKINRHTVNQKTHTHITSAEIKWGTKVKCYVSMCWICKWCHLLRTTDRQTVRCTLAKRLISYNECWNHMGYKIKMLRVHVLNPTKIPVGEDNNRQTDRHTNVQKPKVTNSYKECSTQMGYKCKVLGVHLLNPTMIKWGTKAKW